MQKLQDLVWLWMILGFTILPAIRTWLAQMRRKMLIAKLEKARGTKVITKAWSFQHLTMASPETLVG